LYIRRSIVIDYIFFDDYRVQKYIFLDEQQRKKYIFLDEMHILLTSPEIG